MARACGTRVASTVAALPARSASLHSTTIGTLSDVSVATITFHPRKRCINRLAASPLRTVNAQHPEASIILHNDAFFTPSMPGCGRVLPSIKPVYAPIKQACRDERRQTAVHASNKACHEGGRCTVSTQGLLL